MAIGHMSRRETGARFSVKSGDSAAQKIYIPSVDFSSLGQMECDTVGGLR